jgi:hypothetical protein
VGGAGGVMIGVVVLGLRQSMMTSEGQERRGAV